MLDGSVSVDMGANDSTDLLNIDMRKEVNIDTEPTRCSDVGKRKT